jgi:rubrerythrin
MNIRLKKLLVRTRQTTEEIPFSPTVTYLYGPVGTGKSSVARLIDYCFGGDLERTPAIQKEFIAAELTVDLGDHQCLIERSADDTQGVRVTLTSGDVEESLNVPLVAGAQALIGEHVFNLSDLLFHLCGVTPIKVRRSTRDPDSPLVRLSFRDIWPFSYLEQTHLDSSFFRLEDAFRGRKTQDAMRFFTGLHSDRLSQLEGDLIRTVDKQRAKREAVDQIRAFMSRFELGSDVEIAGKLEGAQNALAEVVKRRTDLEYQRSAETHPSDALRVELRRLGDEIDVLRSAIEDAKETVEEQRALRAELLTAKTKALRADRASQILDGVRYQRCPQCGTDVSARTHRHPDDCHLCGTPRADAPPSPIDAEVLRRDLNDRIDKIADALTRRQQEIGRMERLLVIAQARKSTLDRQLQDDLARYDSSFIENIRQVEREAATWTERARSLQQLRQMPEAIVALEQEAGALQGSIDVLKSSLDAERARLRAADDHVAAIAEAFKDVLLAAKFPGFYPNDEIHLDPRNWTPAVAHDGAEWRFFDTGSGGKKTAFNVCYALAVHKVAIERGLPVPNILVVDSASKNISREKNPELIRGVYDQIYRLVLGDAQHRTQLLLIDSDYVAPQAKVRGLLWRRMAGEPNAPSLIPYYVGP